MMETDSKQTGADDGRSSVASLQKPSD